MTNKKYNDLTYDLIFENVNLLIEQKDDITYSQVEPIFNLIPDISFLLEYLNNKLATFTDRKSVV